MRSPDKSSGSPWHARALAVNQRANGKEITSVLYYPPQEPGRPSGHDGEEVEDETEGCAEPFER